VIAGRDDTAAYAAQAQRVGLVNRVQFVGTKTPLREWYAAADVLAHPTWYDPCSRVVLEALSLGLPVVTTRYNGAAEVMEGGRHGVVVAEPADAITLAAAIEASLQLELRAACAADAERMHEKLSMARHARELVEVYRGVV
jgi:UDP-glucose:(heptosyl)LPS alpha-1,3-glucosyltransferase